MKTRVSIYDTTLRDGSQAEGISYTLNDKILIAKELDKYGIHFIEGGWPYSNEKDNAFFKYFAKNPLKKSKLVAFGSTHHSKNPANKDKNLQSLLKERVPIRNMAPILETVLDRVRVPDESSKDPILLAEFCRIRLGPIICKQFADESGTINVITLDTQLESQLIEKRYDNPITDDYGLQLDRETITDLTKKIAAIRKQLMSQGVSTIVFLTAFELRRYFSRFVGRMSSDFAVISYNELPPDMKISSLGMLEL
jgi:flagellar biosynthesis component FlhA